MVSRRRTTYVAETSSDSDDLPDHPFALPPAPPALKYYDGIPLCKPLPTSAPIRAEQNNVPSLITTALLKHSREDEIAGSSLSAAIDLTSDPPVSYNTLSSWAAFNIMVKVAGASNQETCDCQKRATAGFGNIFLL